MMVAKWLSGRWTAWGMGLWMFMFAVASWAEEPVTTVETITVTAERFPVREKESDRFVTVVSS